MTEDPCVAAVCRRLRGELDKIVVDVRAAVDAASLADATRMEEAPLLSPRAP